MNKRNQTVYMTIGIIGSGKSTWSRTRAASNSNISVVSKDQIRRMIHGGRYVFDVQLEELVDEIERESVMAILNNGRDLIIDECNLARDRRIKIINYLRGWRGSLRIVGVTIPWDGTLSLSRRCENPKMDINREDETYMWEGVYEVMSMEYEIPSLIEGFDEIVNQYGMQISGGLSTTD